MVNSCITRSSLDHWKSPAFDGAQLRPLDNFEEFIAVIVGVCFIGKRRPATLACLRPGGFVSGGTLLVSIAREILGSRATALVILCGPPVRLDSVRVPCIGRSNEPTIPTVGPVLILTVGTSASIDQHTCQSLQRICVRRKGCENLS